MREPLLPVPNTALAALVLVIILLAHSIYKDYQGFLMLGPGGTPSTFSGYLRITFLRLFVIRNPYDPTSLPMIMRPEPGFLSTRPDPLPYRSGPRPIVTGIAPQRQVTQRAAGSQFTMLASRIRAMALEHPSGLRLGTSCFEKHGTGLFSKWPQNRTCNGEICHAHPSDGSLHMTLHPQDARLVLERGWGERHPLAKGGWLTRFVPSCFVMVYAPRDADEVEVVMDIVRCAIWWVGGQSLPDSGETKPYDHPVLSSSHAKLSHS
ncbi:MAG: hypothetical protein M1817_004154 [Caeruleum heppii]|nr:MAG: hypothetical protein M1817_004154 [Caeruleum heppii]